MKYTYEDLRLELDKAKKDYQDAIALISEKHLGSKEHIVFYTAICGHEILIINLGYK